MSDERIEQVVTTLRSFLSEQKSGDGEWPVVTQDELHDLYGLVVDILDAKFERDCDNDQVINFQMYDRRTTFPLPYTPVMKVDEHTSFKEVLSSINDAVGVSEQYTGYAKQISNTMNYYMNDKTND